MLRAPPFSQQMKLPACRIAWRTRRKMTTEDECTVSDEFGQIEQQAQLQASHRVQSVTLASVQVENAGGRYPGPATPPVAIAQLRPEMSANIIGINAVLNRITSGVNLSSAGVNNYRHLL